MNNPVRRQDSGQLESFSIRRSHDTMLQHGYKNGGLPCPEAESTAIQAVILHIALLSLQSIQRSITQLSIHIQDEIHRHCLCSGRRFVRLCASFPRPSSRAKLFGHS
jgi:hypothetical protein